VNQLRTPNIAVINAAYGFDAAHMDLEHNPTSQYPLTGLVGRLGVGKA
jgi:hypothetical protein